MAGVFCGVLKFSELGQWFFSLLPISRQVGTRTSKENTYGATGKSGFLFGIGSDMMTGGADVIEKREGGEVRRRKVGEGEGRGRI